MGVLAATIANAAGAKPKMKPKDFMLGSRMGDEGELAVEDLHLKISRFFGAAREPASSLHF